MSNKIKFNSFILLLLFMIFLPSALSYGISPIVISEQNLLQGSVLEKEILLAKAKENIPVTVMFNTDNNEINEWITLDRGNPFIFPENTEEIVVKVIINVPKNAEFSNYTAHGLFSFLVNGVLTKEMAQQDSNINFEVRLPLDIQLSVTNKAIKKYVLDAAKFPEGVEHKEDEPLIVEIPINNIGNIMATPQINAEFLDITRTQKIYFYNLKSKEETNVKPFSFKIISFKLPNKLDVGRYWLHFNISDNEVSPNQIDDIPLDIVPNDKNSSDMKLIIISIIVICGILLLIIIGYIIISKINNKV
ncbi:hypothetical protein HY636_05385 [Candidatus Woesearchaeota archaeon]|nr:hypothetical protein [Candidatus Woesearchaeota archaeon]